MKLYVRWNNKTVLIRGNPGRFCEQLFQTMRPFPPDPDYDETVAQHCIREGIPPPYRVWKLPLNNRTKEFIENCKVYGDRLKDWKEQQQEIGYTATKNWYAPPRHLIQVPRNSAKDRINIAISCALRDPRFLSTLHCYDSIPKESVILLADMIDGTIDRKDFPLYINDPLLHSYIAEEFTNDKETKSIR